VIGRSCPGGHHEQPPLVAAPSAGQVSAEATGTPKRARLPGWPLSKLAPPKLLRLPAAKQRSLDQLLEKNSEGTITRREKATLEQLVADAERLTVANAKRLVHLGRIWLPRLP